MISEITSTAELIMALGQMLYSGTMLVLLWDVFWRKE